MGILLGQLPSTEVARLKAELAETLIANFCYPRFFDYRTGSLRMRPIDRTKRQEVWQFLSSIDFTSWSRVDLMSPDFQRQVERLFIHFVQRNRSFFGEQGRKRMTDVRILIGVCGSAVTEGLRNHLKGQGNSPFGSPRPVVSWLTTNITGRPEPGWEQLASRTMLIQQQLQEVRGEIKAPAANSTTDETRPATPRRSPRSRSNGNGTSSIERAVPVPPTPNLAENKSPYRTERAETRPPTPPIAAPVPLTPSSSPTNSVAAPSPTPTTARKAEPTVPLANVPVSPVSSPQAKTAGKPAETAVPLSRVPEQEPASQEKTSRPSGVGDVTLKVQPSASTPSAQAQTRSLSQAPQAPLTSMAVGKTEDTTVLVSDEDVVIFEQMRHQLVVWLRIEAVRSGADISGQGPIQLLELLYRQDTIDGSRLQVVSTLLSLSDQVISNRRASLLEYKQAMMFYLMHTRRS